jgi:hypothetical protein
MPTVQALISRKPAEWLGSVLPHVPERMSLFVSIQTEEQIILASDGLRLSSASDDQAEITLPANKLRLIKDTNWVCASVGHAVFDVFEKRIASEIELGYRQPFDPHLEIGGPDYLNTLIGMAHQTAKAGMTGLPQAWIALAGFDIHDKPIVLTAHPPQAGNAFADPITALGSQWPTAAWLLYLLTPSCQTVEEIRRLACFTVWQLSRHEIKIGSPETGYPITSCVLEAKKPPQFSEVNRADLDTWLADWEDHLQTSFMQAISTQNH